MKTILAQKDRGFTLIEIAIVLLIIGLSMGMLLPMSANFIEAQKRQTVRSMLSVVDAALVNFVVQNRRLPCPADGTISSGVANAGVETLVVATGICNPATEINGVVPWASLGISE